MTPKEKAKELIHFYTKELLSAKYSINGFVIEQLAKQCALIAVKEVIEELIVTDFANRFPYWQEVKKEIEKL